MQLHHHSDGYTVLLTTIIQGMYTFGALFIACELCQRICLAFEDCNDMINQFEWYSFPATIQQMLPMTLNFIQQPVEIKCFGSITCDRETFKYVSVCVLVSGTNSNRFLWNSQASFIFNVKFDFADC